MIIDNKEIASFLQTNQSLHLCSPFSKILDILIYEFINLCFKYQSYIFTQKIHGLKSLSLWQRLNHAPLTRKFNLKSDRVKLVAPVSPIECLLYLPNVRAIQYILGPERLTRLGNSNVLRLPVESLYQVQLNTLTIEKRLLLLKT